MKLVSLILPMAVVEGTKKTEKAGGDAPLGTLQFAWGAWEVTGLGVNAQGKCGWAGVGVARSWGWG